MNFHFDRITYPQSRYLELPMIIPGTKPFYPALFKSMIFDESNMNLISGFVPQCLEFLYDDLNTILSLDENVLTV